MESKPELHLAFGFRAIMLIMLLFAAGTSIPIANLKSNLTDLSQGQTTTFYSIFWDILNRPIVFQNVVTHPDATFNILRYFQEGENYDVSVWWLQNKAGLLNLFSDGDTYSIIGNNPWLFTLLRSVNQTYPGAYGKMLNDRHFFNAILRQVVGHPEFKVIFSYHPEYLPLIYNLTFGQPLEHAWTRFIHPLQNATIGNMTLVIIFTLSLTPINHTTVTLFRNFSPIRNLTGHGDVIYNATLNATSLPAGVYELQVTVTLSNGNILQDMVIVHYSRSTPADE